MIKSKSLEKGLVVAIIFLFIGVAIAPNINANIFETDSELIGITTEVCGVKGVKSFNVMLTKQELRKLEELIDSFKERLEKVETREETIEVFRETVVSLDEYNVLPKCISVQEMQRLVSGENVYLTPYETLQDRLKLNRPQVVNNSNLLCNIAFDTTNNKFFRLNDIAIAFLISLIYILPLLDVLVEPLWLLMNFPRVFFALFKIHLREMISFGRVEYPGPPQEPEYYPSKGWVWTHGLLGQKNWSGEFYGFARPLTRILGIEFGEPYIGVLGFTGIKITLPEETFLWDLQQL